MSKPLPAGPRELLIQALGRQSAFWGLGKTTGEIYAALYLSPEPVSLEDLAGRLGVTKGNISVLIRNLERMGMVRRTWQKGDRRVYFEAEADLWQVARRVLEQRQKPGFDLSFQLVDRAVAEAEKLADRPDASFILERLRSLQEFYRTLDSLVKLLLNLGPEQLAALTRPADR
ncbi:MAG: MarR family transcriptional regulator [Peptococcaceae bacterium]|nr:MarR family transcriptional regulator [Peptococcaceae bacterium]